MEAQNRYTAPKMMSLHLRTGKKENVKHINTWIELATSRHVESMNLELQFISYHYEFPDFFYINSSVKKLRIKSRFTSMIPKCSVSWTSLKKLSFRSCTLSDNSIAMILSGCPLAASEDNTSRTQLLGSDSNADCCTTPEANLNICLHALRLHYFIKPDSLGAMVAKMAEMLEKLHNVEKLTLERGFLRILSRPELRSVAFPMFKIKDLTLETPLSQHARDIPHAIEEMLQNSPDLKKLTVHTRCHHTKPGLWKKPRWEVELKLMATGVENLLKKSKGLEKIVVQVDDRYFKALGFEEMVQTLSHNYNTVSIVFSGISSKPATIEEW
ncbi:unnamed protein product [Microthlaspi erraticum]|uniref:FBD domain-containing protein n=1 Tax=Microthlaspi erraticum TaxID=1685480 RepID=A0A6D2KGE0_9BRAS|nr:unnamed protein product [Microthlaspi erraticum]